MIAKMIINAIKWGLLISLTSMVFSIAFSQHLPLPKEPQRFGTLYNGETITAPCKSFAIKVIPINQN
jgi:hypothetical protein